MSAQLTNVVVAGIGGQGVLTASDILADVALRAGFDVKKSEIKGMSQRGGSVSSEVRFGGVVLSPMVSPGEADFLLVLEPTQVEPNLYILKPGGRLITPDAVDPGKLANKKSLNVALLGALSAHLPLPEKEWLEALREAFPPDFFQHNRQVFLAGRATRARVEKVECL
jgi:indolepyruvate ferredoxin oxidoreductase beta subunit